MLDDRRSTYLTKPRYPNCHRFFTQRAPLQNVRMIRSRRASTLKGSNEWRPPLITLPLLQGIYAVILSYRRTAPSKTRTPRALQCHHQLSFLAHAGSMVYDLPIFWTRPLLRIMADPIPARHKDHAGWTTFRRVDAIMASSRHHVLPGRSSIMSRFITA